MFSSSFAPTLICRRSEISHSLVHDHYFASHRSPGQAQGIAPTSEQMVGAARDLQSGA